MWRKSVVLFVVCLFCVVLVNAQVFIKVNEAETKVNFENNQLNTILAVENSASALTAKVKLEVLDAKDNIIALNESSQNLRNGKQNVAIPLNFNTQEDANELLWKRLRYTISVENSSTSNIVSLSEIMPEVFELQISAPEKIFAGMNVRAHILALHPFSKKPIKNVEINGDLKLEIDTDSDEDELIIISKGKTNDEGFASLEFKIPTKIKLDNYSNILKIRGLKNGITREAEDYLKPSIESFVYLNTDKPIYQPNQKLLVRGLYLDPQKRPLADKKLDFEITGENDETVYQGSIKTSRFGVVNIEWQLPEQIKLGKYKIEFENDENDTIGAAEFKVSRYDLPNFTVIAKPNKTFYLTDETTAEIAVNANYLFGRSVERGKVKIVQEKERRWDYENQKFELEEGEQVEGETDANGKFVAKISLSEGQENFKNNSWKRFDDIKFVAYFTDSTTNRTEQKRFDVRLTKEPIHVYFIRQAANPNPRVPFLFYVSTFYADGTPVKCDLKIDGNYDETTLNTKIAEAKTNSYGAGKFEVRFPNKPFPEAKNNFNFRIVADDKKGNRGMLEDNLSISEKEKQIRLHPDKTVYLPNEPIDLRVLSSENEQTVLVDVLKDSSVIYSKNVKIEGGRGNLLIPFRPDFKGELMIVTYFIEESRRAIIGSKTILYPTAPNFNLNLKAIKTVYRPNEDAKISFSVQNGAGKSLETALGVLVLDKAIEERAQTEQLPDNFSMIRKLIGTGETFGNLTRKDLDKLDLTKPIDADLQLTAEFLLANKTFEPNFFESDSFQDDFGRIYANYHDKILETFGKILQSNYEKTDDFPRGETALRQLLSANGINFDELRDAWGTPFQVKFSANQINTVLTLQSASADKKFGTEDDFSAKPMQFEWFKKTQNRLNVILSNYQQTTDQKPQTIEAVKSIWKESGIDFDSFRDGWNRPLFLIKLPYERKIQKVTPETVGNLNGERQEVLRSSIVEQKVILFKIQSGGADVTQSFDDFDLAAFTVILEEKVIKSETNKTGISQTKILGPKGAIGGIILDMAGAVVAGTIVTAENTNSGEKFVIESDDNGEFMLANLPSGKYKITADVRGFKRYVIDNVAVVSMNLIKLEIVLSVGAVESVVEVTGNIELLQSSSSNLSKTVTKSDSKPIAGFLENNNAPSFTPRVREYFPETLVWSPNIITDKNGKAELNFKLADSLTTWKLYAVGSTATGEIGLVEKEFQTFQPFFAELDPPKILTEGDEISLPVPIRNYTDKKQNVAVTMVENSWSKSLNGNLQQIEVLPNKSANAIFNFRAISPVKNGKQRVTASAKKEADAIEKPVTVRPNGFENVENQSQLFNNSATFKVNFPENSFQNSRQTTLKIYPNLLSHVAESVNGLLERPHGCGEQTLSSTYPNLLILKVHGKFKNVDDKILKTAQTYLQDGYKRMLNYQTKEGGYSYWGSNPDIALTGYALRFLNDAEKFIEVDENVVERMQKWLLSQQAENGSWKNDEQTTAYIVRALSLNESKDQDLQTALKKGLEFLKKSVEKTQDGYVLANISLASYKIGDVETAKNLAKKLVVAAQSDKMGFFWETASTPFYGWGKTAEIETTALVLQAILPFSDDKEFSSAVARGLSYLIKNKDEYGVWHSTQTTVNVLDTLTLAQEKVKANGNQEKTAIFINGKQVQEITLDEKGLKNPFILDVSKYLAGNQNIIEIKGTSSAKLIMAQIVSTHFSDWKDAKLDSQYFDLKVNFDKTQANIGEEITCKVEIERKKNVNGMILAEIGIPPAVDVDRNSLERAKAENNLSSYDILPDKIIIYYWGNRGKKAFNFKFKPRYGINALNAVSRVYDYYNPDANAMFAPLKFEVK